MIGSTAFLIGGGKAEKKEKKKDKKPKFSPIGFRPPKPKPESR